VSHGQTAIDAFHFCVFGQSAISGVLPILRWCIGRILLSALAPYILCVVPVLVDSSPNTMPKYLLYNIPLPFSALAL